MHLGQHRARDAEMAQDLGIPAEMLEVEEHRAGGVRVIRRKDLPA